MARYVAFLRGINVSGQKLIKMEELRTVFAVRGLTNITTYIQSGNVLFDATTDDKAALTKKITDNLKRKLGYEVAVIVRSQDEIADIIRRNPFASAPASSKLYVTMMAGEPELTLQNTLTPFVSEGEEAIISGSEVYLLTPAYGNTKLSNNLIEKKLGMAGTTRNWATINKVLTL